MSELRSISDRNLRIGDYLRLPWIFDFWYEKLILVVLCTLGLWKLFSFF